MSVPSCPVCFGEYGSFLNLARHMIMSRRPTGDHIRWLERFLRRPFTDFGWGKDKQIAMALQTYWRKHKKLAIAIVDLEF